MRAVVWALALLLLPQWVTAAAPLTNTVTSSGSSAYRVNGANNANLTLVRGTRYVFNVTASGHPFWIKTSAITGKGNAYNTGVVNNGTSNGTLSFTVPTNAPNALFYICEFHSSMKGTLNIVDPPSPPTVTILSIEFGQTVSIRSTGAEGWNPVPEFATGLPATSWTPIAPFVNTFAGGTNTTTFAPPLAPSVFLRIRNSAN